MRADLIDDVHSLQPGRDEANRRDALKWALGLGYAAAAGPVVAQTAITTPADGLEAQMVRIDVGGTAVPAYVAKPRGGRNLPVVLVVQEIFGVHAYITDVCRRLAREGYLAIAPDLYVRQGNAQAYSDIPTLMREVVAKVPDAQVLGDLDAARAWAGLHGGDLRRVAITGFCWGGRITWLYAAMGQVRAGVAWYGRLVGAPSALTPRHPVEVAAGLKAPVLGLYAGQDAGIPLETVERMRAALAEAAAAGNAAARASRIEVFEGAQHGFHADYRPSYDAAAARAGWQQLLRWLRSHGVARA